MSEQPIARQANAKDGCTGHFWEARFHSQPLCSQRALLTAMAYADLNPIRAKLAKTPESSEYTSIRARLKGEGAKTITRAVSSLLDRKELRHFGTNIRPLMPFAESLSPTGATTDNVLPMRKNEYLKLIAATGRVSHTGKRGRIEPSLEPILERLDLTPEQWTEASSNFKRRYRNGDVRLTNVA